MCPGKVELSLLLPLLSSSSQKDTCRDSTSKHNVQSHCLLSFISSSIAEDLKLKADRMQSLVILLEGIVVMKRMLSF